MSDRRPSLIANIRAYRPEWLQRDAMAGLAVAAVGLPSAIAYPVIAGLPPEMGIYSSILPLLGYALFGASRRLMVGPDAGTMIVLAAVLATLAPATTAERVVLTAALAVAVGVFCLAGSLLRLGIVASFLLPSDPAGFHGGHVHFDPGRTARPPDRGKDQ